MKAAEAKTGKGGRLPHFLCGAEPSVFRRATDIYGPPETDVPEYARRMKQIRRAALLLAPWRALQSAVFRSASRKTYLESDPVFIIGHWQAGHSLMHHMLLEDEQYARVTLMPSVLPTCFRTIGRPVSRFLRRRLPRQRGVDTLPLGPDAPQGDDMMLAGLTDLSLYYGYVFPASYQDVLRRALMFDGLTDQEVRDFMQLYRRALTQVAAHQKKRRLVSRNASNTTRVAHLLREFPEARFIFMHRDADSTWGAQRSRLESLAGRWCLQRPNAACFDQVTRDFFITMMESWQNSRTLLKDHQYIEVSCRRLIESPEAVLRRIFDRLQLGPVSDELSRKAAEAVRYGTLARTESRAPDEWHDVMSVLAPED